MTGNRDIFAVEALNHIPKILTLQDRNPHSPNYGCFDRNFWHLRITDFPSGMSQEFVYPLALAFHTDTSDNPFYQKHVLIDWVEAGIAFAAASSHKDGSCDDYYPYERAMGAAAFSLLACVESYRLLELSNQGLLDFFRKRAHWLAHHQESGRLSNHQALVVICLEKVSSLLGEKPWEAETAARLETLLSWQNEEGWFQEYEGCDPGYLTLTISCLAELYAADPRDEIRRILEKSVDFASHFIHPDGSFGGEYTSRNTYNFFPYGFELVGRWYPKALAINDLFLKGLANGLGPCYADDHIIGHHAWNYLLAWRDFVPSRPQTPDRPLGRFWFKNARLLVDRRADTELYVALNKGGVFKLFKDGKLAVSDTQASLQMNTPRGLKNAVAHLVDDYRCAVSDDDITIEGDMGWAKHSQMTPVKMIVLRVIMSAGGRFFPNLARKLLQKLLITNKRKAPFAFKRTLSFEEGKWRVHDTITAERWDNVVSACIACDQTSIYVVMSRTFQQGQLTSPVDLGGKLETLSPEGDLTVERAY
ncbi:MAG: hypothetical protein JRK53_08330 [Deltaproteobacteria bacterium]|nr:hypothetical protein [Deltaproteobacteria bacterium]